MLKRPDQLTIDDYDYDLPEEYIAKYPLAQRDSSKLLVYKNGEINSAHFSEIADQLPSKTLLIFNNTKVIHARLYFTLPNGRRLEILCLEPLLPIEYQQNLSSSESVKWKCLIGGNRKWKSGEIVQNIEIDGKIIALEARRIERLEGAFSVSFSWNSSHSFGEILASGGIIPLPPYLNRDSEKEDEDRYQTIYAKPEGSVAAPTAGLHFSEAVFKTLDKKKIQRTFVTLHVGAGTFKPVKADHLGGHEMHQESIFTEKSLIETLLKSLQNGTPILPVGTTSMRTLESLYWFGVQLHHSPKIVVDSFFVGQWEPYEQSLPLPSPIEAFLAILKYFEMHDLTHIQGHTQLLIAPGYKSQLIDGLVTNFHQPRSTLLLLVAALIGDDWKRVYEFAKSNQFRFLSYGDSSLLWKNEAPERT